jgi:hypothetical protein
MFGRARSILLWLFSGSATPRSGGARHKTPGRPLPAAPLRFDPAGKGSDIEVPVEFHRRELKRHIESDVAGALDACAAADRLWRPGDPRPSLSRYQNVLSRLQRAQGESRELGDLELFEIIAREKEAVLLRMQRCGGHRSG